MSTANPYEQLKAPVTDAAQHTGEESASPTRRLAAAVLDLSPLVLTVFNGILAGKMIPIYQATGGIPYWAIVTIFTLTPISLFSIFLYPLDLVRLKQRGQTFGKRIVHIKIVRTDGSCAGLARIFFLRFLIPYIIIGGIPVVGWIFILADHLFIFRKPRRCIHDYLADTSVVNVRAKSD